MGSLNAIKIKFKKDQFLYQATNPVYKYPEIIGQWIQVLSNILSSSMNVGDK